MAFGSFRIAPVSRIAMVAVSSTALAVLVMLATGPVLAESRSITATVSEVPESHDGTEFTFKLNFSPEPELSYKTLRYRALSASNATVKASGRLVRGNDADWRIVIEPDAGHRTDIIVTLAPTVSCSDPNAICTLDGSAKLDAGFTLVVMGPDSPPPTTEPEAGVVEGTDMNEVSESDTDVSVDGMGSDPGTETGALEVITADFSGVPEVHDGSRFGFDLNFSIDPDISYRILRYDGALEASDATIIRTLRNDPTRSDSWRIQITPDAGHRESIAITLHPTFSCDDPNAICNVDDTAMFSEAVSVLIPGPDTGRMITAGAGGIKAEISGIPSSHDGEPFSFDLRFNRRPDISYLDLRNRAITADGGSVTKSRRAAAGNDKDWKIEVTPHHSYEEVIVTLEPALNCFYPGSICTANRRRQLTESLTFVVPGEDDPPEQDESEIGGTDGIASAESRLGVGSDSYSTEVVVLRQQNLNDLTIPDAGLRRAINVALGRSEDSTAAITATQMAGIAKLDARERDITNLIGLSYATGLIELNLSGNHDLVEIDLSANTAMERLLLNGTSVSVIGGLGSLTSLTHLRLFMTDVSSIDLSANTALTHLTIGDLWLRSGRLRSIDLSSNTALTYLSLQNNKLREIGGLSALSNLTHLNVQGNRIGFDDIGGLDLSSNTALTYVNAMNNDVRPVFPPGNSSITHLFLGGNSISTIEGLNVGQMRFGQVTHLNLTATRFSNVRFLRAMPNLKLLSLAGAEVSEIDLSRNVNLEWLYLEVNDISALDVDGLTKIKYMSIHSNYNRVSTATPIDFLMWDEVQNRGDLPSGAVIYVCVSINELGGCNPDRIVNE